ncbi:ATP-dependent zinc protease family protein [Puniceicoccus vermicola]|uniref:ATP-dependent zinc protease n=1 Tax=Puniceicoccus vermicola TaxID=388746 RepID=A0A7X1E423_9BACT|nr:RimK/LysX family protein [Puniceicoccus vermicola]MBC2602135.1 ATP-dependent zinc protease [Puniceicoccus vermicola]
MSSPMVIGWREWIDLPDWNLHLRAKADTGAKSSAIDCAEILELPNNRVQFKIRLSRKKDELITVEEDIKLRKRVRSTSGHGQERLFVETTLELSGVKQRILVSLVCRKNMIHRMLLGRETLSGAFVVDSSVDHWVTPRKRKVAKKRKK